MAKKKSLKSFLESKRPRKKKADRLAKMVKGKIHDHGFLCRGLEHVDAPDYIVCELKHDSQIVPTQDGVQAPQERSGPLGKLNDVLNKFDVHSAHQHFPLARKLRDIRQKLAPQHHREKVDANFAKAGFMRIRPKLGKHVHDLVKELNRHDSVWKAVVAPQPIPASMPAGSDPGSRNFEFTQGYLDSAPEGIGALCVWGTHGAKGKGVTVCDIEGGWHFDHESLPDIKHLGGTPLENEGWKNHGTAVMGAMLSQPGSIGTVGICHEAKAATHSAYDGELFAPAGSISDATSKLKAGDVLLIELQAKGPNNGKYIAMQYWDDVFAAIRAAVEKGIVVIEAAGNSGEDLDRKMYADTGLQKDSGAIVVGAGIPPNNGLNYYGDELASYGFGKYDQLGEPRSRIFFSNYGGIVDAHGWGFHVTSTGYGDAQGGSDPNKWYTQCFTGTSSATPLVAGAAACIQGYAKKTLGEPLAPEKLRKILVSTGTAQVAGPKAPLSQNIGPQPDLAAAIKKVK
ncbi:MAG: S8 family serine peptidase [Acidobacteriota bacterium]